MEQEQIRTIEEEQKEWQRKANLLSHGEIVNLIIVARENKAPASQLFEARILLSYKGIDWANNSAIIGYLNTIIDDRESKQEDKSSAEALLGVVQKAREKENPKNEIKREKLHPLLRQAYLEAKRPDIAFGDDPAKLMTYVRNVVTDGELGKMDAEVWENKWVLAALTSSQWLTFWANADMTATGVACRTLRDNPDLLCGQWTEEEWTKKMGFPKFDNNGAKIDFYPHWAQIPGLTIKAFQKMAAVDTSWLVDMYNNAPAESRKELRAHIGKAFTSLKPGDLVDWDTSMFAPENQVFDLVTRNIDSSLIGSKDVQNSIIANGKPKQLAPLFKNWSFFGKPHTQEAIIDGAIALGLTDMLGDAKENWWDTRDTKNKEDNVFEHIDIKEGNIIEHKDIKKISDLFKSSIISPQEIGKTITVLHSKQKKDFIVSLVLVDPAAKKIEDAFIFYLKDSSGTIKKYFQKKDGSVALKE